MLFAITIAEQIKYLDEQNIITSGIGKINVLCIYEYLGYADSS